MILRSSLVIILSLALVAIVNCHQDTETPSAEECQPHIDAALKAFQHDHLGHDDKNDVADIHDTDEDDLEEEANEAPDIQHSSEDYGNEDDIDEGESTKNIVSEEEKQSTSEKDIEDEGSKDEREAANDDEIIESADDDGNDDEIADAADDDEEESEKENAEEDKDDLPEEGAKEAQENDITEEPEDDDIPEIGLEETKDDDIPETGSEESEDDDDIPEAGSEESEDDDDDIPEAGAEEYKRNANIISKEESEQSDDDIPEEDTEEKEGQDDDEKEAALDEREAVTKIAIDNESDVEEQLDKDDDVDESNETVEKEEVETKDDEVKEETEGKDEDVSNSEVEETQEHINATEEDEQELLVEGPGQLRSRDHIEQFLHLTDEELDLGQQRDKVGSDILKELKKLYEGAVRPLEQLYKFKDVSNRHLGDAEIFSKPMVVFMGPWSTGKSAIINYLLGTEYSKSALKTGAEPTSNTFTVLMYGDNEQVLHGTQLAADWAFSSLQKFGQSFLDRLRGRKLPIPLLRKMTIVDTPGIIENRKERTYPFNDAFQWFIDRADLIYIVFDPTKLDIGFEMEALFDQLKGRESQVRILVNKADIVKPQELMKVQGNILWNLSPLLGTVNAPTIYVGSFWSKPYLPGSPFTLFDAQEEAMLEDIYEALENQIENKVAVARRHAVRVRNHAKMVDCYLNTYYNHKTFFSNKRQVADDIVGNPQNYHIYEGMSTLTNVSRYDLPDPDIYREFFSVHPLFDFKPLASTCSYFKGCPLDKLDITIAYDLPELVGKYHRVLANRPPIGGR